MVKLYKDKKTGQITASVLMGPRAVGPEGKTHICAIMGSMTIENPCFNTLHVVTLHDSSIAILNG